MATVLFVVKATIPRKKEAAFNYTQVWPMLLTVPIVGQFLACS